jgi:fluoride ion exporter CrcB/FEX
MKEVLIGGLAGSIARYKIGGVILHHSASWRFPLGTFAISC